MRIAIMGTGGIGGFYGAQLALAGNDVWFIARGAHLQAIREHGLRVDSQALGDLHVQPAQATDNPVEVGAVDAVLVTTKAYDLESAAEAIRPMVGAETVVLPLLNGVDIADRIGAHVGREHLLGGLCYISAAIAAPGMVREAGAPNRVVFGELDGGPSERVKRLETVMRDAGIPAEGSDDVQREIWRKFMLIDAASGVSAVTASPMGPVLADEDTRVLFVDCMREVEALARRKGVDLPNNLVEESLAFARDKMPYDLKPSMLHDLEQGRKLEVDALNGTVARLGREMGVETPVNRFIHAALKLRAGGTA